MKLEELKKLCDAYENDDSGTLWYEDPPREEGDFIDAARTMLPKLIAVAEAAKDLIDAKSDESRMASRVYRQVLRDKLAALEAD